MWRGGGVSVVDGGWCLWYRLSTAWCGSSSGDGQGGKLGQGLKIKTWGRLVGSAEDMGAFSMKIKGCKKFLGG